MQCRDATPEHCTEERFASTQCSTVVDPATGEPVRHCVKLYRRYLKCAGRQAAGWGDTWPVAAPLAAMPLLVPAIGKALHGCWSAQQARFPNRSRTTCATPRLLVPQLAPAPHRLGLIHPGLLSECCTAWIVCCRPEKVDEEKQEITARGEGAQQLEPHLVDLPGRCACGMPSLSPGGIDGLVDGRRACAAACDTFKLSSRWRESAVPGLSLSCPHSLYPPAAG